jgi:putative ATPase
MPEARIPIAQAIIAVCMAEKSNSVVEALGAAEADARNGNFTAVPVHLRDQSYAVPHSQNPQYKFPHDYPGHFAELEFMPAELSGHRFYEPADNKQEDALRTRLESLWPKYYKK